MVSAYELPQKAVTLLKPGVIVACDYVRRLRSMFVFRRDIVHAHIIISLHNVEFTLEEDIGTLPLE